MLHRRVNPPSEYTTSYGYTPSTTYSSVSVLTDISISTRTVELYSSIMHSRKTITIVTSPATSTKSLPSIGCSGSPTTKQAPVYRVEERSRTIYLTSDVNPAEWDTHSLNAIFNLAEAPEVDHEQEGLTEQPIRRTHSSVDTQFIISEEAVDRSDESRVSSPRMSVFRSRRPGVKSASGIPNSRTTVFSPGIPPRGSPPLPTTRQRVLFYHKYDPYYGFTNFSPHPVIYKGKKYPTSEHLFQSFKVSIFILFYSFTGLTLMTLS